MEINEITELIKTTNNTLPASVEQTDGVISSFIGFFNNVVLYPIKVANIKYKYKLEYFEKDLRNKMLNVPVENIKQPDLNIAGPALESLKYTFDNDCLREMYLNLLAKSMDSRAEKKVHPSYVDIIRQMNEYDAHLFAYLAKVNKTIKAINPYITISGTNTYLNNITPQWFINYFEQGYDIYSTSASLCRLANYGLIDLMFDRTAGKDGYEELKKNIHLLALLDATKKSHQDLNLIITATESVVIVNDFGKQFAEVCLPGY